jgi:hypothetical protein
MGRCASTSTSQPRITVSAATAYGFFPLEFRTKSQESRTKTFLMLRIYFVYGLSSIVFRLNSIKSYIIGDSRIYQIVSDSFIRF